jgi:hypothetical protein
MEMRAWEKTRQNTKEKDAAQRQSFRDTHRGPLALFD